MSKLSPTVEEIDGLRRIAPKGPIVMINLLKFRPGDGRQYYKRYIEITTTVMPQGTTILYTGQAGRDVAAGEDWDFVGIVEYPSFEAFANMVTSDVYQNIAAPLRPLSLLKTLFMISFRADLGRFLG
jgi:uncharacterized protein (DUF1330 family)